MRVELESVERLRFADGSPVRAASAVAPFGDGFLVAQDDTTGRCAGSVALAERRCGVRDQRAALT